MAERWIDDVEPIREALLEWYDENHRPFPWRDTTDPYAILVCEIMSQQTQLERIREPWAAFLERWSTTAELAAADRAAVVEFWSEHRLGYNNRAVYLHDTATTIESEFDGTIPESPSELETLPGVGPYTANAVASFAFNAGGAVVDTNVRRVYHRVVPDLPEKTDYEAIAAAMMPEGSSRRWNNAIMELGGTVCEKSPRCDEAPCPLRRWCDAYARGDFVAPDVSTQPAFEGSRRQYRGRIVRALGSNGPLELDALGHRIRVDYTPEGDPGREWLRDLLEDLEADGLVSLEDETASLRE